MYADVKEAEVRRDQGFGLQIVNGSYWFDVGTNYEDAAIVIPSTVEYQGITYTVTTIDDYSFFNCEDLVFIEIPSTVTFIGEDAFHGTKLESDPINWEGGCFYIGDCLIRANPKLTGKATVKSGTRLIAYGAFNSSLMQEEACEGLTEIVLPNTVAEINQSAFEGCVNLTGITIPSKVKEIMPFTFFKCYKLKSLTLPRGFESIGYRSLTGCHSLQDIYCSSEVTMHDRNCFPKDISQITVHAPARYKAFYEEQWTEFKLDFEPFEQDGIYYDLTDESRTAVIAREKEGKDNYASKTGIVTIPKNVMDELDKFKVTGMAEEAFAYAPMERITIESEIVKVPQGAFAHASKLTDAVLPKTVARIEDGAFEGCAVLSYIPALTNTQQDFLPNLDRIGEAAFKNCAKLPKLWLMSVTSVGKEAFSGCTDLKDVTIGAQVQEIGAQAFDGCTNLQQLTNYADKPQPFKDKMINGVDKKNFVIYVHKKSLAAFQAADGWKEFTIKVLPEEADRYTVNLSVYNWKGGTVSGAGTYDEGAEVTLTATPDEGYHFVRWSDGETKSPYVFTITEDMNLQAIFEQDVVTYYYDLKLQSADEKLGTVSGGGTHIEKGTVVNLTVTPAEGCELQYWTDSKGAYWGKLTQWTVYSDETLTAHFRVIPDYDEYLVYVMGEQVTSANANDILDDGVWAYDRETHTLTTMKDATYKKENASFIQDWETKTGALTVVVNHKIEVEVESTDEVIREAMLGHNGMKITGSKNKGIWLTAKNMYPIQMTKTLSLENHVWLSVTFENTTEFGKKWFDKVMLLNGTPALSVNGAWAQFYAFKNGKVSNVTDEKLELINAEAAGSMDDAYMEIHDLTPLYDVNYLTETIMDYCLFSGGGSYYEGEVVTLRALPVTSYEFVRWSDGTEDNPYTFIMPAHDVLIDPVVKGEDINPDGGIINAYAPVGQGHIGDDFEGGWFAEGTVVTITAEPEPTYDFVQWSDGNKDNPRIITVESGKNISIVAEFAPKPRYTVTFVDWDGAELKVERVYEGFAASAPEDPVRKGYTFQGWDKEFDHITADLIVKAQFEINTFTVRFLDFNGKQIGEDQIIEWNQAALAPEAPEVEGYTFLGWNNPYDHIQFDLNIYAEYEIKTFTVYFYNHDGEMLSKQTVRWDDAAYAPEDPVWEGHTFTGWDTDFEHVHDNLDITAVFDVILYTVKFVDWEGTELKAEKVEYGKAATAPDDPSREGYTFTGWDSQFDNITADLTVKAQYAIITYKAQFGAGEHGKLEVTPENLDLNAVPWGTSVTLTPVPDEYYEVEGWSDKGIGNTRTIVIKSDTTVNVTFVQKKYMVTFIGFGGATIKFEYVPAGEGAQAPELPLVHGYHFTGWDKAFDLITADLTVTALYEINKYEVVFLDWDGKELKKEEVEHGSAATAPKDPERENFTFTGWDKEFDNITSDLTVTAQYEHSGPVAEETTETEVKATDNGNGDVLLEWPVVEGADTYIIQISKGGELVCTLTFNAQGQLLGIHFAMPARDHANRSRAALLTAGGWQYTVTLDPGAEYSYTMTAKNGDEVLYTETVAFTTDSATGIDNGLWTKDNGQSTKVMENGVLYIMYNGTKYNVQGKMVK